MKIEMGESLGASWLKHVRKCVLVQTNWKTSPMIEFKHREEIGRLFEDVKDVFRQFGVDVFKKNNTIEQLVRQTECDVIGMALGRNADRSLSVRWEALEVAFHEGGLQYGSKKETVAKVAAKMIRIAFCLYAYMDTKVANIAFASPKVHKATAKPLEGVVKTLQDVFKKNGFDFRFNLILNERFNDEILRPVIHSGEQVSDTAELFLRGMQLIEIFEAKGQVRTGQKAKPKRKPVAVQAPDEKIAAYARRVLPPVLNTLSQEDVDDLCNVEWCKFTFKLSCALLSKEKIVVKGKNRTDAKPLNILGQNYYMTNDWHEKNRGPIDAWIMRCVEDETNLR